MKKRSHIVTALLLFVAFVAVLESPVTMGAAVAEVSADGVRETFQSIYGVRLKQVQASRDRADDTVLAKQMVDTAKQSANVPALAAILCNEAHGLTKLHEPAVALDAMRLLAEVSPADRKTAHENMARLLTVISRVGDVAARKAAVNELIALYTSQGDAALQANDWREASGAYRKALYFSSQQHHSSVDSLKNKIKAVAERERTMRRVEQLEETVLRDANDQDALKELVLTYVLDLQQSKKAATYVPRVKSPELKSKLSLAVQDFSSLNASDSFTLGKWFSELAGADKDVRANSARELSVVCLERFLAVHTAKDIQYVTAGLLLKQARDSLAKSPVRPTVSKPSRVKISPAYRRVNFRPPSGVKLAVSLSFDDAETSKPVDATEPKRAWVIKGAKVTDGVKGPALNFDGKGSMVVAAKGQIPDVSNKRIVVATWIKTTSGSGVIFSYGRYFRGYALHLKKGQLIFSSNRGGHYRGAQSKKLVDTGWCHVAVDMNTNGVVTFYINGKDAGSGSIREILSANPDDVFSIGTDDGGHLIKDYGESEHFKGIIDEFQVWISE